MAAELPPWLQGTFDRLVAAHEAGRLPHGLLIHGPGGWGQDLLAEALVLEILGKREQTTPAHALAHPDLRWLGPEKEGGQIRIDGVRALAEFVARTASAGTYKVAVISPADAMNLAAANALLKTLEEPPRGTHLVLVATHPAALPATVRSRCQSVSIAPAPPAIVSQWLATRLDGVDSTRVATSLFEYGNAPYFMLDAIARDEATLEQALVGALAREAPLLQIAEAFAKEDTEGVIVRWMRYLLRELARRASRGAEAGALTPLLAPATAEQLHLFFSELQWARRLLLGTSNPNRRLLVEALLTRFRELRHGTSH